MREVTRPLPAEAPAPPRGPAAARRVRLPRERWLHLALLAGPIGLMLKLASQIMSADPDMFHQMALFREALERGWLPREDVFAYTPTVSPVIHHEWANGAVLYLVSVATGWGGTGLLVLRYLLLAAIVAGVYGVARRRGASVPTIALLAPIALCLFGIGFSPIRAQYFSFLFLACLLLFLELDREGRRGWVAAWLVMYVAWVNVHGGFVVGLGLFGLHALERFVRARAREGNAAAAFRETRHLAATLGAMLLAVLATPYGWHYVPYIWGAVSLDRVSVSEWAPLWAEGVQPALRWGYAISLLFVLYGAAGRGGLRRAPGLVLVLAAAYFALRHQRLLPMYAIVWLAYVPALVDAREFGAMIRALWRRHARLLAGASLASGLVWGWKFVEARPLELRVLTAPGTGEVGIVYPAGVVDYLAAHSFTGNVMTPFETGAFVSWKLHPAVKVSFDGRYEVAYPLHAIDEVITFYQARPGWEEVLGGYPTDAVIVPRRSPVHALLEQAGGAWRLVYRDDGHSLFARADIAARLPVVDRTGRTIPAEFP